MLLKPNEAHNPVPAVYVFALTQYHSIVKILLGAVPEVTYLRVGVCPDVTGGGQPIKSRPKTLIAPSKLPAYVNGVYVVLKGSLVPNHINPLVLTPTLV
jgi:hypothetical protein